MTFANAHDAARAISSLHDPSSTRAPSSSARIASPRRASAHPRAAAASARAAAAAAAGCQARRTAARSSSAPPWDVAWQALKDHFRAAGNVSTPTSSSTPTVGRAARDGPLLDDPRGGQGDPALQRELPARAADRSAPRPAPVTRSPFAKGARAGRGRRRAGLQGGGGHMVMMWRGGGGCLAGGTMARPRGEGEGEDDGELSRRGAWAGRNRAAEPGGEAGEEISCSPPPLRGPSHLRAHCSDGQAPRRHTACAWACGGQRRVATTTVATVVGRASEACEESSRRGRLALCREESSEGQARRAERTHEEREGDEREGEREMQPMMKARQVSERRWGLLEGALARVNPEGGVGPPRRRRRRREKRARGGRPRWRRWAREEVRGGYFDSRLGTP